MNYIRKAHVITCEETGESESFTRKTKGGQIPTINGAKRQSRRLQAQGHTVRVEK